MEWIEIISNVGFPIALSIYLLLRVEKVVGENTKAINELRAMLNIKKEMEKY